MKSNKKCTSRKLWAFMLTVAIVFAQIMVVLPAGVSAAETNLAQGKAISCNNYTQTYVATNANDGNQNTYWEGAANAYPNTLTVDLGTAQTIAKVNIKLPAAWGTRTQTLSVLGSTDNVTYTTLVNSAVYTFNPASSNVVTITFTSTSKRYVRLNFTANSGSTGAQVSELEITSGTSATPTPGPTATPTTTPAAPTPTPNGQPDLIVTNITWSPASPVSGNEVTFSAVVKNQGTGVSAAGVVSGVQFQMDGTLVNWCDTYSTPIQPGASVTLTANSGPSSKATWTATNALHTVLAWVDDVNRIAESNESNNQYSKSLAIGVSTPTPTPTPGPTPTQGPTPTPGPTSTPMPTPVPGTRGAVVPYTRYESENATMGGGATLKSDLAFDYAQIAAQASNQKYVELPSSGSYVEWTATSAGAGVDMRFTMPDTGDGMGQSGSLDCYVNGVKTGTIALTSYFMWQYFAIGSDSPQDSPNGGIAAFAFDETHWTLPTALKSGDKIRIQSTGGLTYGVDFLEVEAIPAQVSQPANTLAVTSYGAVANDGADDLAAFNSCVTAAIAAGKGVFIPAGTFNLSSMWVIGSSSNRIGYNMTIAGAGIWYTNIKFTNANAAGGGISFRVGTGALDFSNMYINSNLRSRYSQNAIYKCFMDDFGTNSKVHDFWEEHFECGFWVADYATTPVFVASNLTISNGRVRNNLADGINFCQGTNNSTVTNCSVRNNGDDGLACWPDSTMGAPMEVNNKFTYNTIENNWRAGGIAFFGGSGHQANNNYIKDCFMGSGIRMNTTFPGYHFESNTGISFTNNTIVGCGTSHDCYNGERGAVDLEASNSSIQNVTFTNTEIYNTQRDAVQFGYGGGFSGVTFNNTIINTTGLDTTTTSRFSAAHLGAAIYTYTGNGTATFHTLTLSNIELPALYQIQSGFTLTIN